jgi:DNA-binding transcriptional MerR regulator
MPYKKPEISKMYYTISEVAEIFGLSTSNIRFWENEFDILKPKKNAKGNRLFTPVDIDNLHLIYHLIKERGLTLKGAKQRLKDNKDNTLKNFEIVKRLKDVKSELLLLDSFLKD